MTVETGVYAVRSGLIFLSVDGLVPALGQQAFHSKGLRGLQMLPRYWWPRFVATIGQSRGHGVIDQVIWIDAPGDHAERVLAAAREAFRLR